MKLDIEIGRFSEYIEEYKQTSLHHNQELDVRDLGCYIDTPTGETLINYIIKKDNLEGIILLLESGVEIKCAKKHILRQGEKDVYAENIKIGDKIESINGPIAVVGIFPLADSTFYDIGIDAPHLYYDSDGILHHNTILTAALSYIVERNLDGRSIVIVPNKDLVRQTYEDYKNVGLDVGMLYGDQKDVGKQHTICTWQSLNELDKKGVIDGLNIIDTFIMDVKCVIVDEAHGAKGEVLQKLLAGPFKNIPVRWGLTGTVPEHEFQQVALLATIGDTINQLTPRELIDKGVLAECEVNGVQLQDSGEFSSYQDELKFLTTNKRRLHEISKIITEIAKSGNTLVLVDRIAAGKILEEFLEDVTFISGADKSDIRKDNYDRINEGEREICIATYGIASTGINIPRIFNLVMLEPGKSYIKVIQSIGRGIRKAKDKESVQIWDISSSLKYSKRHLTKRKKFYKDVKYPFHQEKKVY